MTVQPLVAINSRVGGGNNKTYVEYVFHPKFRTIDLRRLSPSIGEFPQLPFLFWLFTNDHHHPLSSGYGWKSRIMVSIRMSVRQHKLVSSWPQSFAEEKLWDEHNNFTWVIYLKSVFVLQLRRYSSCWARNSAHRPDRTDRNNRKLDIIPCQVNKIVLRACYGPS